MTHMAQPVHTGPPERGLPAPATHAHHMPLPPRQHVLRPAQQPRHRLAHHRQRLLYQLDRVIPGQKLAIAATQQLQYLVGVGLISGAQVNRTHGRDPREISPHRPYVAPGIKKAALGRRGLCLVGTGRSYLILPSLYSTCLRTTGSYLRTTIFSVMVRAFFLVT